MTTMGRYRRKVQTSFLYTIWSIAKRNIAQQIFNTEIFIAAYRIYQKSAKQCKCNGEIIQWQYPFQPPVDVFVKAFFGYWQTIFQTKANTKARKKKEE